MLNQGEDNKNPQLSSFSIEDRDQDEDQDFKFVIHKKNLSGDLITTHTQPVQI